MNTTDEIKKLEKELETLWGIVEVPIDEELTKAEIKERQEWEAFAYGVTKTTKFPAKIIKLPIDARYIKIPFALTFLVLINLLIFWAAIYHLCFRLSDLENKAYLFETELKIKQIYQLDK